MRDLLKLFIVSTVVFVAAYIAELALVPDVAPFASPDMHRSLFHVALAFLLKATQNVAILGAGICLVLMAIIVVKSFRSAHLSSLVGWGAKRKRLQV